MPGATEFVEQTPLVLPALRGKSGWTPRFGALWNCRNCSFLEENIFGSGPGEESWFGYLKDKTLGRKKEGGPGEESLVVLPRSGLVYTLNHVRNTESKALSAKIDLSALMEINILFATIKINVGSAHYKSRVAMSTNVEEVVVKYEEETAVVRLLPPNDALLDAGVREKLVKGSLDATHVLTEMFYGVELLSTIRMKKMHSDEFEDKAASGLGGLVIGPVSAVVKAGLTAVAQVSASGDEDSLEISLESNIRPPLPKPTSVDQLFSMVEGLKEVVQKGQRPFPKAKEGSELGGVLGWPIRYFLVPINQFLSFEAKLEPVRFRVLETHFLEEFTRMVCRLKDFGAKEFLRKHICSRDQRLKQMLSDTDNGLCKDVLTVERDYLVKAKLLYERSRVAMEAYQNGNRALADLQRLVDEYHVALPPHTIEKQVNGWVKRGRDALDAIHADDIIEGVVAKILTSPARLKAWKEQLKDKQRTSNVQLLLVMGEAAPVPGSLLGMYNLSQHMEPESVAIALPGVGSEEDGDDGTHLQVFLRGKSNHACGWAPRRLTGQDMSHFLSLMATANGGGEPVAEALHELILAVEFKVDIHRIMDVGADVDGLGNMLGRALEVCRGLTICETFLSLREELHDEIGREGVGGRWVIVMTPEAHESAMESYQSLMRVKKAVGGSTQDASSHFHWVVGSFNIGDLEDAPLLFLFRNGALRAVCMSNLEVALLEANLPDFLYDHHLPDSTLQRLNLFDGVSEQHVHNCFHPERATFALRVARLFSPTLAEQNCSILATIRGGTTHTSSTRKAVEDALSVTAAMAHFRPKEALVSALTHLMATEEGHGVEHLKRLKRLKAIIQELDWSPVRAQFPQHKFDDVSWTKRLRAALWSFAYLGGGPWLRSLGIAIRNLQAFMTDAGSGLLRDEELKLRTVVHLIPVRDAKECGSELKGKIKKLVEWKKGSREGPLAACTQVVEVLEDEARKAVSKQDSKTALLLDLLDLCTNQTSTKVATADAKEEKSLRQHKVKFLEQKLNFRRRQRLRAETERLFKRVVKALVLDGGVQWPDEATKHSVGDCMRNGLHMKALGELSRLKHPAWMKTLFLDLGHKQLSLLLLQRISLQVGAEGEEIRSACWMNPQWQAVMHHGLRLHGTTFVKYLIDAFCTTKGDGIQVPSYLTPEIEEAVNSTLASKSKEGERGSGEGPATTDWEGDEWEELVDVLSSFEKASNKEYEEGKDKHHHSSSSVLPSFYSLFRRSLRRRPALRAQLKRMGVQELMGWDEEEELVHEPVPIHRVRVASERILQWLQDEEGDEEEEQEEEVAPCKPMTAHTLFDSLLPSEWQLSHPQCSTATRIVLLRRVKGTLLLQSLSSSSTTNSVRQLRRHWARNVGYRHIILALATVIQLPDPECSRRNAWLRQLDLELMEWARDLGRDKRRVLGALRHSLKAAQELGGDNGRVVAELSELIEGIQEDLTAVELRLTHFFYELHQLYMALQGARSQDTRSSLSLKVGTLDLSNFPRAMTDYFEGVDGGGSIPLFEQPGQQTLNSILLDHFSKSIHDRQRPLLVVTLVGLADGGERRTQLQRSIVHALCSGEKEASADEIRWSEMEEFSGKSGMALHRVRSTSGHLPSSMDLFLLETKPCLGQREGGRQMTADRLQERKLTSFAASISSLILVDWDSTQEGDEAGAEELLDLVAQTMIDCGRLQTCNQHDILFVSTRRGEGDEAHRGHLSARLTTFLRDVQRLTDEHGFEFGLPHNDAFSAAFGPLHRRIENGGKVLLSRHELKEWFEEESKFGGRRDEWRAILERNWTQLRAMYHNHQFIETVPRLCSFESAKQDLARHQQLCDSLATLRATFLAHAAASQSFLHQTFRASVDEPRTATEKVNVFEETTNSVLQTIREHLATVPLECTGLMGEGDSSSKKPCITCACVLRKLELNLTTEQLKSQESQFAEFVWRACAQSALVQQLQTQKGGATSMAAFDAIYERALKLHGSMGGKEIVEYVTREMRFWCADQVRLPRTANLVSSDIGHSYSMAPPSVLNDVREWLRQLQLGHPGQPLPSFDWPHEPISSQRLKVLVDDAIVGWVRECCPTTSHSAPLYLTGMLEELKWVVQDALREGSGKSGLGRGEVGLERVWTIHAYAIKLFVERMEEESWKGHILRFFNDPKCVQAVKQAVQQRLLKVKLDPT